MSKYLVTCQDAAGKKCTITISSARSDQAACDKALKHLNSWRAIRAVTVPDEEKA